MPAGVKSPGASAFKEVVMELTEEIHEMIGELTDDEILVIVVNHVDETPDG